MRQLVALSRIRLLVVSGSVTCIALFAIAISTFSIKPSDDTYVTDVLQADDGNAPLTNSENNSSLLKPYPSDLQSAARDLAESRNPFSPPTAMGSVQGVPGPLISIKGFAQSKDESKPAVFLSINQSQDLIFQIGQEVGNGYRIVSIEPPTKSVIISDGINRLSYALKEF